MAMAMSRIDRSNRHPRWRTMLLSILVVCGLGVVVSPQVQLDVCGCKNNPGTLGNFDTTVPSTYPPGVSTPSATTMDIQLPPDGVLVFDSMNLQERPPYIGYGSTIRFIRNAAGAPVVAAAAAGVRCSSRRTARSRSMGRSLPTERMAEEWGTRIVHRPAAAAAEGRYACSPRRSTGVATSTREQAAAAAFRPSPGRSGWRRSTTIPAAATPPRWRRPRPDPD